MVAHTSNDFAWHTQTSRFDIAIIAAYFFAEFIAGGPVARFHLLDGHGVGEVTWRDNFQAVTVKGQFKIGSRRWCNHGAQWH